MPAIKRFICAKNYYKLFTTIVVLAVIFTVFAYAKKVYTNPDFGKTFGVKASVAEHTLQNMQEQFSLCTTLCKVDENFLQSIVFPEVMRYNTLKDGIETESLRTLYVQFGAEYANFSIGLFQMKPTFAQLVEEKAKSLLPDSIYKELQLEYTAKEIEGIRQERVDRLQDKDWQMVYLTAFVCICNTIYKNKLFANQLEKLQWYATVYNAGFDKTDAYITQKITSENFYLNNGMPGKKFRYAAIAGWYYGKNR